jgi:dihydroorotase
MPLLTQVFEEEGALDRLEAFCSHFGAEFYGLPITEDRLVLRKEGYMVPEMVNGAVPLMAGKEITWSLTGNRNSVE